MTGMLHRFRTPLTAVLACVGFAAVAAACPFCTMQGQTLTDEVGQASMVLYGTLQNPRPAGNDLGEGTTELVVEAVIKDHPILNDKTKVKTVDGKKIVTLSRYVPTDRDNKYKFIVFCDVFKGQIDPYRGVAVRPDSDAAKYLQGAVALKDKDVPSRLRFFFNYLDNPDVEISNDAYKEFGNASYKDFQVMAKDLPADKIARWLQDPKTPGFRLGLYASMLGHCGKEEHASILREMLTGEAGKGATSGLDGIMAGYVMLKPKEGWEYLRSVLKDRSRDFTTRYAALRAVRFFWENRPEVVGKQELVEGISLLLDQEDIADLAIEDLRKWGQWDLADRILALRTKKSHEIPIVRRAILRYALSCPKPQAAEYVKQMRQKDPQMVQDAEELLKLENTPPPSAAQSSK